MRTFSPDDADRESLSDALGTTDVAINRYRLPPGEGLPSGLHTHLDQEEVFVVLEGTVTFETLSEPVVVGAGEAVRFAPGEYQTGTNDESSSALVLALGAPKESEQVRVPLDCPDCGHRGLSPAWDGGVLLTCPDCGGAHRTRGCPECERAEMEVRSGEGEEETVVVCPDCGAERSEPRWA
ncbi:cupin domain-containing protein [Halolamina salina]|uniref:Cupin domain-containing protein n=1 Tax=Halolamina salina TaxID=1220023 RepID=A0ABD6B2Q7_9EURY